MAKKTYPAKKKAEPKTPAVAQETAADTIGNTRRWARMCHGKQTDKAGYPYVVHLDAVARNTYMLVGFDKELLQAAYLHDMVEDTTATSAMLLDNGFSKRTADTVYAVTKVSGEANYDYISFIIDAGLDAMIVKLADLYHNTEEARIDHKTITPVIKERLLKKYLPAIWRIERALIASGMDDLTPTVTFEQAKEACMPKPVSNAYAPKWRVSTSPSTVVANDLMKFSEGSEEDGDKFALRVKNKTQKGGEYTFTFHDSDSKVALKQGDSFWVKWGGGAAKTAAASTATSTWTPEWIKYLGLPKDWKEGDDLPDPLVTFNYTYKAKTSTAPAGVTPKKYESSRKNSCPECHVYSGHLPTCQFYGECDECLAPKGEPHWTSCSQAVSVPPQPGKDLLVLGNATDGFIDVHDPDTGEYLGTVPEGDTEGFGKIDGSINYAGPSDYPVKSVQQQDDAAVKKTFDDLMREVDDVEGGWSE